MTLMGMGGAGAYGRDVRIVVTAVDNASGTINAITKTYKSFGDQLAGIGRRLTLGVTAPLMAIGIAAVKSASDYESAFIGVMKTTEGLGESIHDLTEAGKELWQGFVDLSKVVPVTAAELAGIGEIAGQLGIPKENILDFTNTIAELGMATNLTVNEAATSFARFANITRMPLDDIHKLGSSITELGNNTATTEAEIMDMAMRVAGVGAVVGLTQPQILGWAAAMSELGLRSQMGGTALSRAFVAMHESVSAGGEVLETFARIAGMTVEDFVRLFETDASGAMESFIGGLADIDASGGDVLATLETLGLSQIRVRDTILRLVGGYERLSSVMGWAEEGYEKDIALTREAERRKESFASQTKMLVNELKALGISFGEVIVPALRSMIALLTPLIQGLAESSDATKILTVVVGSLAAAVGPALLVVGSFVKILELWGAAAIAAGTATGTPLVAGVTAATASFSALLGVLTTLLPVIVAVGAAFVITTNAMEEHAHKTKSAFQEQEAQIRQNADTYDDYVKSVLEYARAQSTIPGVMDDTNAKLALLNSGLMLSINQWYGLTEITAEAREELAGLDPTLMNVKKQMAETTARATELRSRFVSLSPTIDASSAAFGKAVERAEETGEELESLADIISDFGTKTTKVWANYYKGVQDLQFRHVLNLQKSEQIFQQKYAALLGLGLDKKAAKLKSGYDHERGMAEYNHSIQKQLLERSLLEERVVAQTAYVEKLKLQQQLFVNQHGLQHLFAKTSLESQVVYENAMQELVYGMGQEGLDNDETIYNLRLKMQQELNDGLWQNAHDTAKAIALLQQGEIENAEDLMNDLKSKLDGFRIDFPPLPPLDLTQFQSSAKKATKSAEDMAEEIQETLLDAWESTGVQNALDELLTIVAQFNSDMEALVREQEELYRYRYNFARKYIDLQTTLEAAMNDTLIDMQFDYNLEARKQAIAYNNERLQLLRQGRTEEAKELLISYAAQRSQAQYSYDVQLQLMGRANLKRQIERQEGYIVELQLQRDNFLIAFAQELSQNDAFLGLEATQQEALLSILSVGDQALLSEHLGYAIARTAISDALAENDIATAVTAFEALLLINAGLVSDTEVTLDRLRELYENWEIELPDLFTGFLDPITTNLETAWTDFVMTMQDHYVTMEEMRTSYQERESEAWFNHHLQSAKEMALYYKRIELLTEAGREDEIADLTDAIHKKHALRDWEIQIDLQLRQRKYIQDQITQQKAHVAELIAQRHHFQMMYVEELMHSESFLALDFATQESLLNIFTGGQNAILDGAVEYANLRLRIETALANGQLDVAAELMRDLRDIYSGALDDASIYLDDLENQFGNFTVTLPPIPDIMAGISEKAAKEAGKAKKDIEETVKKTALEVLEDVMKSLESAVKSAKGIVGMLAEFMLLDQREVMRGFERFVDFIVEAVERMYEAFERIDIPIEQLELLAQKAGFIGSTFRDVAGITGYAETPTTTDSHNNTNNYEFNLSGTGADLISQMLDQLKLLEIGTESA